MNYNVKPSSRFKKDLKKLKNSGYNLELLRDVVEVLKQGKKLEPKYEDHPLHGTKLKIRECHIQPDWLLVYELKANDLILYLVRTGTHSDIF